MTRANASERVIRYTTAPQAYDSFGTQELAANAGHDHRGTIVRKVAIEPEHLQWQEGRYGSGMHASVAPEEAARFRSLWTITA